MANIPQAAKVKIAVVLISIPFVEVGLTVFLTRTLGAALTYSLFAIPTITGLIIQGFRWKRIKPIFAEIQAQSATDKDGRAFKGDPEMIERWMEFINFWFSVVLLLIPGFVTDVIAFYLMYSSSRKKGHPASKSLAKAETDSGDDDAIAT